MASTHAVNRAFAALLRIFTFSSTLVLQHLTVFVLLSKTDQPLALAKARKCLQVKDALQELENTLEVPVACNRKVKHNGSVNKHGYTTGTRGINLHSPHFMSTGPCQ